MADLLFFVLLFISVDCQWVCEKTTWNSSIPFQYPPNENYIIPHKFNCTYKIAVTNNSVAIVNLEVKMFEGVSLYFQYSNETRRLVLRNGNLKLSILPPYGLLTLVSEQNSTDSYLRVTINWRPLNETVSHKLLKSTEYGLTLYNPSARDITWVLRSDTKEVAIHPFSVRNMHTLLSILAYDGNVTDKLSKPKFLGSFYEACVSQKPIISTGSYMTIRSLSSEEENYFYAQDSSALDGVSEVKTFIVPASSESVQEFVLNGTSEKAVGIVLNNERRKYFMTNFTFISTEENDSGLFKIYPVFPSTLVNLDSLSLKTYVPPGGDEESQYTEVPQALDGMVRFFTIYTGTIDINLGVELAEEKWRTMSTRRVVVLDIEGLAVGEKKSWDFQSNETKKIVLFVKCEYDNLVSVTLIDNGNATIIDNMETTNAFLTNFTITAQMNNTAALGCTVMITAYDLPKKENGYTPTLSIVSFIISTLIFVCNHYVVMTLQ